MIKTLIAATLIAILAGMGTGSGGFLVIYLTQIENVPQIAAQGINLIFFILSAAASTLINAQKLTIKFKETLILSAFGAIGCLGGAFLVGGLDEKLLTSLFGGMLVLSGAISLFKLIFSSKKGK